MLLRNLMEEKQLDFNQPLLSVRRFSSTGSNAEVESKRKTDNAVPRMPLLPVYKSDLKSGPVRNPGAVPFVWEQTPGRPKDESKLPVQAIHRPAAAPKLPPGRILNAKEHASDKGSEGAAASRPQTRNDLSNSQNVPSLNKTVTQEGSSKGGTEETATSGSEGDDAYVDALDTLSRSESFFLNCSISGVSGLDGPDLNSSGTFSKDLNTRDFMMGRFLPAAKAMASETPQCSTRKQPAAREQQKQIKKVVIVEKQRQFNQYRSTNIPHYARGNAMEDSEDDDDYEGPDNSSLKVCGILPRLCFQNSFCLLNPVPGMKKQVHSPVYSVRTRKMKSSCSASCCETENECYRNPVYEQKSMDGPQTKVMHASKKELRHESNKITRKSEPWKLDGSSMYKRLQGNGSLPRGNQFSHSAAHEEKRFLGIPGKSENVGVDGFNPPEKGGRNFRELLADERNEWESGSSSPVVEKTLYIDSVLMVKPQNSNSSFSDTKDLMDYRKDDVEILVKHREIEKTSSVDSSLHDIKHLSDVSEKEILQLENLESVDSHCLSQSDKSTHDVQMDVIDDGCRLGQDLTQVSATLTSPKVDGDLKIDIATQGDGKLGKLESSHGLIQDSIMLTIGKMGDDGKIDLERKPWTKLSDHEISNYCSPPLPLPPPLPKSPSESWLKRTLPTLSSKNSPLRSPGFQASKTQSLDSKWETIVKATNVQQGHLRSSKELLAPIPES